MPGVSDAAITAGPALPGTLGAAASDRSHQITRFLILRLLGLVYLVAFLVFLNQGPGLVGHAGLTPAADLVARGVHALGSPWRCFRQIPSLFWFDCSDRALFGAGLLGIALSALLLLGFGNAISLFVLWALYLSIIHVGGIWWGYGWENQLTETGFLAMFLCPLFDPRPFPRRPPPPIVIQLFRWLIVRIMLGAGLIKLRGDDCWRDLTCLDFHFLTQPIPNPLSPLFHALPGWAHKGGVLFNHFAEVVCPFFAFGPKRLRRAAGVSFAALQIVLVASGNLAFLNWLTLVPILACFDDEVWLRLAPARLRARLCAMPLHPTPGRPHTALASAFAAVVAVLSVAPVENLFSPHQAMNTSYDPLELVNSYGAFGSVGKVRNEIVFEGTADALGPSASWKPYEFKCKPGDPDRRPCFISPYHLRLDWQIWFAAMEEVNDQPWTVHLVWKLLHNDPLALGLLAGNPFPGAPPRYVRARLFRYDYAPLSSHAWWTRTDLGDWLPPLSADDPRLSKFLRLYHWLPPAPAAPQAEDEGR